MHEHPARHGGAIRRRVEHRLGEIHRLTPQTLAQLLPTCR